MLLRINLGQYPSDLYIEPKGEKTLRLKFRYNRDLIDEVKAMEGARWWPDEKCWTITDSQRNWFNLNVLSGKPHPYDKPVTPVSHPKARKNQLENISAGLTYGRILIADEMGLGKSFSAIKILELAGGDYTWIVCPKSAKFTWQQQFNEWAEPDKNGNCYTEGFGKWCYKLITYDAMTDIVLRLTPEKIPVNVVFDEMHKLKNHKAQRTQAAMILTNLVKGKVIGLTGTPNPKNPTDWWSLSEIICPGFLRESTPTKLMKRLAYTSDMGGYFKVDGWNEEEIKRLYRRLKGLVQIHFKKDCPDIPEKIYIRQEFEVDKETMALFNFIKKSATNALTALGNCRQFSDGFQYNNESIQIPTPKDEALREDLSEFGRDRLVIYAGFTASVDKIVNIAREEEWSIIRQDGRGILAMQFIEDDIGKRYKEVNGKWALEQFQSSSTDRWVYIGQPDAGGLSLNLQRSQLTIFYSNTFKGDSRWQAEDRIHRIGTVSATIKDYLWLPTDKYVLDNLLRKKDLQALTLGDIQSLGE